MRITPTSVPFIAPTIVQIVRIMLTRALIDLRIVVQIMRMMLTNTLICMHSIVPIVRIMPTTVFNIPPIIAHNCPYYAYECAYQCL